MKSICVVCCCYNEADNIERLYKAVTNEIDMLDSYEWSILFEDNCSTDGTVNILRNLAGLDSRVKVILNQSNYGATRSSSNAVLAPIADAIICMASDLEDPPSLIPKFVEAWEAGNKVVMGQYTSREGNVLMNACRRTYYKIMTTFSGLDLPPNTTGFGLYDAEVVNQARRLNDYQISLRYLCLELGYDVACVSFDKPKRKGSKSSFSVLGYCRYAIDSLVYTSYAPLRIAGAFGGLIVVLSVIAAIACLIWKLFNWDSSDFSFIPIVISIFFIGGMQLLFIGLIGEYLAIGLKRLANRPFVIEKERINFD